jgi:hypothetical protein
MQAIRRAGPSAELFRRLSLLPNGPSLRHSGYGRHQRLIHEALSHASSDSGYNRVRCRTATDGSPSRMREWDVAAEMVFQFKLDARQQYGNDAHCRGLGFGHKSPRFWCEHLFETVSQDG